MKTQIKLIINNIKFIQINIFNKGNNQILILQIIFNKINF